MAVQRELWPPNLVPKESVNSAAEAKVIREVVAVAYNLR
jgi:hypothetical protein